jgi:hypothetical protein
VSRNDIGCYFTSGDRVCFYATQDRRVARRFARRTGMKFRPRGKWGYRDYAPTDHEQRKHFPELFESRAALWIEACDGVPAS